MGKLTLRYRIPSMIVKNYQIQEIGYSSSVDGKYPASPSNDTDPWNSDVNLSRFFPLKGSPCYACHYPYNILQQTGICQKNTLDYLLIS